MLNLKTDEICLASYFLCIFTMYFYSEYLPIFIFICIYFSNLVGTYSYNIHRSFNYELNNLNQYRYKTIHFYILMWVKLIRSCFIILRTYLIFHHSRIYLPFLELVFNNYITLWHTQIYGFLDCIIRLY